MPLPLPAASAGRPRPDVAVVATAECDDCIIDAAEHDGARTRASEYGESGPPPSHAWGAELRGRGGGSTRGADAADRRGRGAGDECTLGGAPADHAAADHSDAVERCGVTCATTGAAVLLDRRGDLCVRLERGDAAALLVWTGIGGVAIGMAV